MTSPLGQGPCAPLGSRVSLVGLRCLWACSSHCLPCSSRKRRPCGASLGLVPPRPLSGPAAVGPCRPAWRCPRDPPAAGRPAWGTGALVQVLYFRGASPFPRERCSLELAPASILPFMHPSPRPCRGRLCGRAPKISFAACPAGGRWWPRPGSPGPWVQGVCRRPRPLLASSGGRAGLRGPPLPGHR